MSSHHHRSLFKQQNKPFKGKSKGAQRAKFAGRVSREGVKKGNSLDGAANKADRVNNSRQRAQNKRAELVEKRRVGSRQGPPKVIGVIALGSGADLAAIGRMITEYVSGGNGGDGGGMMYSNRANQHTFVCKVDKKIQKFIVYVSPRTTMAAMDIAKVADMLLMVAAPDPTDPVNGAGVVDDFGYYITSLIKNQGLPNVLGVVQGCASQMLDARQQAAARKLCTRYVHTLFDAKTKVVPVDTVADMKPLFRWLYNHHPKEIGWREQRSYMVAEALEYNAASQTMCVLAHLRGCVGLNANELVHVTGYDDYQIRCIDLLTYPTRAHAKTDDDGGGGGGGLVMDAPPVAVAGQVAVAELQTELSSLQAVDPMATYNDQSMITEEEIKMAEDGRRGHASSSIQGAWDEVVVEEEDGDDGDEEDVKGLGNDGGGGGGGGDDDDTDVMMGEHASDDDDHHHDDAAATADDEEVTDVVMERRRLKGLEDDESKWPDEVETPIDRRAKERFLKYRGLQKFRQSPWDKFENLPMEYSRIYSFQNFAATRRRVLNAKQAQQLPTRTPDAMDVDGGDDSGGGGGGGELPPVDIASGMAVRVHLMHVTPAVAAAMMSQEEPVCVWGLLQYEHKVSVLHFAIRRHDDDVDEPVKGKMPMAFHVGFRRFVACPIYSKHTKGGDKHLVERFLQKSGRYSVASVYQRITYTPAPVIMVRPYGALPSPQPLLNPVVATGTLLSVNPHRLLIKRTVLSGYPISVHRRSAVIRYMFFHPDDVRWFKKIELWTKHGLTGHIREPHGLKGQMKCVFNSGIKQHDVVCMSLYKRQFIPWSAALFDTPSTFTAASTHPSDTTAAGAAAAGSSSSSSSSSAPPVAPMMMTMM